MMEERVVTNIELDEDRDNNIRPSSLDEYVGQSEIKENLNVFIKSSLMRRESLDHILLYVLQDLVRLLLLILLLMTWY